MALTSPFLKNLKLSLTGIDQNLYPFSLPIFRCGAAINSVNDTWELEFKKPITFLVGENGTGKSTLMEAIAAKCGFNPQGGNKNHVYSSLEEESVALKQLEHHLRAGWLPKVNKGFFLRAESFFNFASYLEISAKEDASFLSPYGGKSLHKQSHGESFMALFRNKFGCSQREIYLLDEPEAALSPKNQLVFLKILMKLAHTGKFQFIIATHSPILMSLPNTDLLYLTDEGIKKVHYQATDHFILTKDFINHPEHLLLESLDQDDLS